VRLTFDNSGSYTNINNAWCAASVGSIVYVVWRDTRYVNWEIFTKRSTDDGTTWEADTRLTNDSSYSLDPSVAVSGTYVHVVWDDNRDGTNNYEIYTKCSTDYGVTWGPDTRLSFAPYGSGYPSVGVSGADIHVVWHDFRDGNYEIYTKRSTDHGTTWGPETRLTNDIGVSWYPSVAVSDSTVHVVWVDLRDSGSGEIYYKRSTDHGATWGPDTRLTNEPAPSYQASVAVFDSNVHVAWCDNRDGNIEIYTKRSTDNGTSWESDTRLTYDTATSRYPSLAVSGSNVHLVWEDNRNGNDEIYGKRSTNNGTSWGSDTLLTTDSVNFWPSIAVSGYKVHVLWTSYRDGNAEVYYKRNPTGNSGVGESIGSFYALTPILSFSVIPNPFVSFTTFPGHSSDRFTLYDISGRRVGTYRGDRIGEGLRAGVYFLRALDSKDKPLRIVKVR